MPGTSSVYRPRRPQDFQYYQCVEDQFERFERVYDERFSPQYGFFRPYVKDVIWRYLDCGMLNNGFAVTAMSSGENAKKTGMKLFPTLLKTVASLWHGPNPGRV